MGDFFYCIALLSIGAFINNDLLAAVAFGNFPGPMQQNEKAQAIQGVPLK